MKKLWQKPTSSSNSGTTLGSGNQLDSFVEEFETQSDIVMDQYLIPYDIEGSKAHVKMLAKIGILTQKELDALETGLSKIAQLYEQGKFVMEMGDEDMHTKIENYLTDECGEVGKKIHTGRSRNDQILTTIRLYTKDQLATIQNAINELITTLEKFNSQYGKIPMPGYTHMQKAMPSSIGLWIGSFASSLKDDLKMVDAAYDLIDQSPLGSGAGYGVPLNLDRAMTAKLLGFKNILENPIYAQSSKGKFEAFVVSALLQVLQTINKLASDVMLFSTQEFGYFSPTSNVTTGSSMMPQKKNLDLAELLRNKVHIVLGGFTQLVSMTANLPSGYNRDLQEIKKPLIESLIITIDSLKASKILVENIHPNEKKLKTAMTDDLLATEKALKLAKDGKSFRDAYQEVGKQYEN